MKISRFIVLLAVLLSATGMAFAQAQLVGAGATFPQPLYTKMFEVYGQDTGVKVNYQGVGSGAGQAQLKAKTVDFGASDVVMTAKDMADSPAEIVQIPIVAGAAVMAYNLPGDPKLRFTPDVIANIFLGNIKSWDDARIAAVNPSVKLPKLTITVVHRSDGSGTTGAFSDYLCKVSSEWKTKVGTGTSLNWPVGVGGKGTAGVAGLVKQLPGAIGYVELVYVLQNKMAYGDVQNSHGNWITPSLASTSSAAQVTVPADITQISLTNTDAADGYPISTFTWILLFKDLKNQNNPGMDKASATVKLVQWMIHDGQKLAEPLSYATLPAAVAAKADAILKSITYDGTPLLK